MKIAYVYDAIYPWIKGGAEKRIYEISKRLVERGHEVHWFGIKWWDGSKDVEHDGIYLHGVGKWNELYTEGRRSIGEALYFGWKVSRELKGDFDVIDCQQFPYFSCFGSRLKSSGSRFIITWYEVWGDYWFDYLGKKGVFGWLVEKLVAKLPHVSVPVSDKVKDDLKKLGVPEEKMRVVPNGVDFYRIQKVRENAEGFDVIYVGRLISHKNVDVLLRAIAEVRREIPDIRCGIIGDGPERQNLVALSRELGIGDNVKFFGFIESDEEVYSCMKSSKLFVLPSIREGFPNTILEANACGLPAIIVRHEKNAGVEVVKDGYNGYRVELSHHEIAEKIINLLQDEKQLSVLRENSKEFARNHEWSVIVDKIENVYKEGLA